jgi:hypothetical protein
MHATTNMLVDARVSLFVIYPGLKVGHFVNLSGRSPLPPSAASAEAATNSNNPFADEINFGIFVNETGGRLFYNRNDVDAEIGQSQQLGSMYYTLTYQPHGGNDDGKFRQIRVSLRDPNLRTLTKTGYFAPDNKAPIDPRRRAVVDLAEATRSTVPFGALDLKVSEVVRHPETRTAQLTVLLKSKGLDWQPGENGDSTAAITVATASMAGDQNVLAAKIDNLMLRAPTQDPTHLAAVVTRLELTVRVPRKPRTSAWLRRLPMEDGSARPN